MCLLESQTIAMVGGVHLEKKERWRRKNRWLWMLLVHYWKNRPHNSCSGHFLNGKRNVDSPFKKRWKGDRRLSCGTYKKLKRPRQWRHWICAVSNFITINYSTTFNPSMFANLGIKGCIHLNEKKKNSCLVLKHDVSRRSRAVLLFCLLNSLWLYGR